MANAGYSGTPLEKKLGLKPNFKILLYNAPKHYFKLFDILPEGIQQLQKIRTQSADFIHIFCTSKSELEKVSSRYKKALKQDGLLWVSWPKGSSAIETDLKREPVRDQLLFIGLVDTKVCAVDENWSGLKFVYRLKDRK